MNIVIDLKLERTSHISVQWIEIIRALRVRRAKALVFQPAPQAESKEVIFFEHRWDSVNCSHSFFVLIPKI